MSLNENFSLLPKDYLFAYVSNRISQHVKSKTGNDLCRLGIGDVTLPIVEEVKNAMITAVEEMSCQKTFKGYGDELGYDFLRNDIKGYYQELGVEISSDEVFVTDGAKSDLAFLSELFSCNDVVLIFDPVYPAYRDVNLLAGRKIICSSCNKENDFLPLPNSKDNPDVIYICSPNNPTGATFTLKGLKAWVDYAKDVGAIIVYDCAYSQFITDDKPKSIYLVSGAEDVAVEVNSFSKWAGFTGLRCGYTVVRRKNKKLYDYYRRAKQSKFNGVSFVTQRRAQAIFAQNGKAQIGKNIDYYVNNFNLLTKALKEHGIYFTGNAPYVFMEVPKNINSVDYFERLLKLGVVCTPGSGFGLGGEGYVRLSCFATKEEVLKGAKIIVENY